MPTDIFEKYKTKSVPKTQTKAVPSDDIFSKYKETATKGDTTIDASVEKITPIERTTPEPDPSFGKKVLYGLGAGLKQGAATVATGINAYNKWFYNTFNQGKGLFGESYEKDYQQNEKALKKYEEKTQKKLVARLGEEGANSFVTQASAGLGQGIGQLASFAIHPVVGFTTIAAQTVGAGKQAYDTAYQTVLDQGGTEEQARKIAKVNGIVTGAVNSLEVIPVGKAVGLLKDVLQKPVSMTFKGVAKRFLGNVATESVTEGAQQFGQDITAQKTYDKNITPLKNAIMATLISIPTGILFGTVGEVGIRTQRKRVVDNAKSEIEKKTVEAGATPEQAKVIADSVVNQYAMLGDTNEFSPDSESMTPDSISEIAGEFQDDGIAEIKPFLKEEAPQDEAMFKKKEGIKQYKNADEFVRAQGRPIYHGSEKADIIEKEGLKLLPEKERNMASAFGDGVYLTTSRADAKGYGGVVQFRLPKNARLFKVSDSDAYKIDTKKLIAEGYDGVELGTGRGKNITIFDPSKLKTRSQLIEEYNKSKGKSKVQESIEKLNKSLTPEQGDIQTEAIPVADDLANNRITEEEAVKRMEEISGRFQESFTPEQQGYFDDLKFQKEGRQETVPAQTALEVIKKMSSRLGLDFPTYVYKKIYTGEIVDGLPVQAFGMFLDNAITLAELVTITTGQHEMVHLVFRNLDNIPLFEGITRNDLYAELKKIPGNENLSKKDLEEKLAEGFEQYALEQEQNKPTTFTGKLKEFFEELYDALKSLLNIDRKQYNAIEKFYDTMYFGKSKEVITLYDTEKTSQFMEARFKEFGEEVEAIDTEEVPMFQIQEEYQRHVNDVQIEQIKGRLKNLDVEVRSTEKQIIALEKKITVAENKGLATEKLKASLDTLENKWELLDEQRASLLTLENKMEADLKSKDITVKGKTLTDVAKMGERFGVLTEKQRQAIRNQRIAERKAMSDRQIELKSLREGITKRLYTKNVLDLLRKDIPRKEWSDFMTRLSQVGLSETKYLDLVKSITDRKAELDVDNADRIDRSRIRSNIAYLKKVYDIEPSLILSIKEDLDIRDTYKTGEKAGQKKEALKSIKEYSIEELQFFMDELQKRIDFRKENAVNYLNYGKLIEEKTFGQKLVDSIVKIDETVIATMERTLQKISKPVYESMMTVFFQMEKSTDRYSKLMEPIYEIYDKANEGDKELIKLAAQSSNEPKLRSVLEQYATKEEVDKALNDVRTVLDEIHTGLKDVGVDVPYRGFFFPRKLKQLTIAQADLALKIFENKIGKKATGEEKNVIINNFLRGFDVSRLPFVTLSGKKFESHRMIETLTDDLSPFYEDFSKALNSYVFSAINTIETRKYFGKFEVDSLDYEASLSQSIGAKVYELFDQGIVKQEDLDKLRDIMQTVFQYRVSKNVKKIQELTNSLIYPLTLGQIGSAINQIKDLSLQMLLNDIFSLQLNTLGDLKIKPSDVYLTDSFAELETGVETEGKFAKMAELILTPFSATDKSFLRIFINATKRRLIKQAKAGNKKLTANLIDIFGEEKGTEVLNDLKGMDTSNNVLSDEIARVIWGEVAKVRPITKLQKTRTAVRHPYLYTLRNFMMKQIQFVRSQSLDHIAEGVKTKDKKMIAEGVGRLVVMMSFIGFFGAGVDELKDFILGKSEDKGFWDRVLDNLLQVVGFNTYLLSMGDRNGYGQQFLYSYIPATASVIAQTLDAVIEDVKDTIDGDSIWEAKTLRKIPLVGELFYQRFGGSAD